MKLINYRDGHAYAEAQRTISDFGITNARRLRDLVACGKFDDFKSNLKDGPRFELEEMIQGRF